MQVWMERKCLLVLTSGGDLLNKLSPTRYCLFLIISNCSAFITLKLLVLLLSWDWFFPPLISFKDGDECEDGKVDCNKCFTRDFSPLLPSSLLSWLDEEEELWGREELLCCPIWRLDLCLVSLITASLFTDSRLLFDLGSLELLSWTSGEDTSIEALDKLEEEFEVRDEFEWLTCLIFECVFEAWFNIRR